MTCLERILTSKSVQALLDICIGPELDSRGKTEQSKKPRAKRVGQSAWQNSASRRRDQFRQSAACTMCRSCRIKFPLIGIHQGLGRSPALDAPLAEP
jgi:hypothetical protein